MSDLWPSYAKTATTAEGQNAEPGDRVQKMYECVYATTSVLLQALGYPDTEPTDLMNLVHPGGHVGGEDYGVVAAFLRSHPQRWPGLPTILLINPPDTLTYLRSALAAGYAVQMDVKDDRNANVVAQWPAGWQGTHSVIVVGDAPITVWNPWAGDRQSFPDAFFQAAATNPAGNFMVFQRDIRNSGGLHMDADVAKAFSDIRNTFKKLAVNQVVEELGATLSDSELDKFTFQVADDFHNLRAVGDAIKAAHPPSAVGKLGAFDATISPK